ncbi:MAG: hypothetical protein ACSNEK_08875, partial [Parachlamydiaceae bacterium]
TSSVSASSHPLVISYERLTHEIQEEITILRGKKDYFDCTQRKIYQIADAIARLAQAVMYQCDLKKEDHSIASRWYFEKINPDQAKSQNLSTYDAMLDAAFSVWEEEIAPWREGGQEFSGQSAGYYRRLSIRQALNLSRNHLFNIISTFKVEWGPLWGKTDTLKAIEDRIKRLPVEE